MKKILILLFLLFLSACEATSNEGTISIIVPNGSPAIAQVWIEEGISHINNHKLKIDRVSGVDPLVAAFATKQYDIIIAPSNLGARLGKDSYKLVAGLTYGNLFLAAIQSNDLTLSHLLDKTLIIFGQNAIPDLVLRSILHQRNITPKAIEYVATIGDAHQRLIQDNEVIIMSAEPQLSVLMQILPNIKTCDLQDEWEDLTGKKGYLQSAVFMKNTFIESLPDVGKKYLAFLEQAAYDASNDVTSTASKAFSMDYGFPEAVLTNAITRSYIRFTDALQAKEDFENFYDRLLAIGMGLVFGPSKPDESFYHIFS